MPDEAPTVRLIHAEPMADSKGRERIVALLEDGDIAVASRAIGEEAAEFELAFNLGLVSRLARQCLAGNSHALTTPGLARYLCAGFLALERAAYEAGILVDRDAGSAE